DLLARRQDLRWVAHPLVAELGHVQEAFDATEVDERAVVLELGDRAADDQPDGEGLLELGGPAGLLLLEDGAAGQDQVHLVAAARLEPRDAEPITLADVDRGLLDEAELHL